MSMSAFSHHCWLLFNFPLVTGRSVGIFCPFRRCLCNPETLQLLSALNPMLPLSQMQLGHFRGLWCLFSLLRSMCSWLTFTMLCWQTPEQHRYSILAFSVANRALCALQEGLVHMSARPGTYSSRSQSSRGEGTDSTSPSQLLFEMSASSVAALESCQVQTWTYVWHVHECSCLDCWYKSWNFSSLVRILTVVWYSLVDVMLVLPGTWESWVQDWVVPQASLVSHESPTLSV